MGIFNHDDDEWPAPPIENMQRFVERWKVIGPQIAQYAADLTHQEYADVYARFQAAARDCEVCSGRERMGCE